MATRVKKDWAAVRDGKILLRADTKEVLKEELAEAGHDPESLTLVSIPTP